MNNSKQAYEKHENLVDLIYKDLRGRNYKTQGIGRHVNYGVRYHKIIGEIDIVQYSHLTNGRHYFILHEVKGTYRQTKKAYKQLRRAYQYMLREHHDKNIKVFCMLERGNSRDSEGRVYDTKWLTKKELKIR